ncbi:MAG: hypothetical protein QM490_03305 [Candidatus Gracilibacteria bacterium]
MEISPFLGTLLGNTIIAFGILTTIFVVKTIKNKLNNYLEYITALTVGLLLGIIFLGFIPELTELFEDNGGMLGVFILVGLALFYIFELFLHWHHCKDLVHKSGCEHSHSHEHKKGFLMLGGTILHNAFHGIILFSAFSVDFNFGLATSLAILLHSIPQNIVNYIMNQHNIKYAYLAAFGGILGALLTFPFADFLLQNKSNLLAIITGGLLYTALADIFPEFKGKGTTGKKLIYLLFMVVGVFIFLGFNGLIAEEHGHGEDNLHLNET